MTDLQRIQDDVLDYMKTEGVDTKEAFGSRMSSPAVHEMLQTKLAALPHVGALNLFNAQGWLINSSEVWPIPDVTIVDRRFFRDFTSGQPAPDMIVEPVRSKVTGNWTTILARRILGKNGEIIGFASRGVEPHHFENFVASLALNSESAILMIHRDGTIIARYPHDDGLVGRNIASTPLFKRVMALGGNASGRFTSMIQGEERVGSIRPMTNFPIFIVATTTVSNALADWRA